MKREIVCALLLLSIIAPITRIALVTATGPQVDSLVFKVYHTPSEALQGLSKGEVDLVPVDLTPETLAAIKNNPSLELTSIPAYGFTYIAVNLRSSPLSDPQLRQAMMYGFDREKVVNYALQGYGEVLGAGLFSSAYAKLGLQNLEIKSYQYDPEKAKSILDQAGYTIPQAGGFRLDPSTQKPLSTLFIYSKLGNPIEVAGAGAFARDMQAIGLPILHVPQPNPDFGVIVQTYNFDMIVMSEDADSAPTWLYDLFVSPNDIAPVPLGSNLVGYHNRDFDACASQMRSSTNLDIAKNAAFTCQSQIAKDLPVIPVYSEHMLLATGPSVPEVVPVAGSMAATIREAVLGAKAKGDFGGELRVGVASGFENLDPTSTSRMVDWLVLGMVAEPLLSLDQDGKLAPGMADQWSVAENGASITFLIRANARFHTGEAVKPTDFVATIHWLISNVKRSSSLYGRLAMIDKVETIGEREIKVTLKAVDGFAANSLGQLFAFPEGKLTGNLAGGIFLASQVLVSSGPFTLVEFRPNEVVRLGYNDQFYGAPPEHKAHVQTIEATKGELLFGARVTTGTEVVLNTKPLMQDGQPVVTANYTLFAYDSSGKQVLKVSGTHKGQGVYTTTFSADDPSINLGDYKIEAQLFAASPQGGLLIVNEKNLTVRSATPFVFYPLIITSVLAAVVIVFFVMRRRRSKWPETLSTGRQSQQ